MSSSDSSEFLALGEKDPLKHTELQPIYDGQRIFKYIKQIGEGGFGGVHLYELTTVNGIKNVAVKTLFSKFNCDKEHQNANKLKEEMEFLKRLDHPNIVYCLGIYETEEFGLGLVMEYCARGNYRHFFIDDKERNPEHWLPNNPDMWNFKTRIIFEITKAMEYLHSQHIIHLDLKPDNVLLDALLTAKVSDFGLSRSKTLTEIRSRTTSKHGQNFCCGTPGYIAPELYLTNDKPTTKCDVFSFGITIWYILSEKTPYDGKGRNHAIHEKILNDNLRPNNMAEFPKEAPVFLKNIMLSSWDLSPLKRLAFKDIVKEIEKRELVTQVGPVTNKIVKIWKSNSPCQPEETSSDFSNEYNCEQSAEQIIKHPISDCELPPNKHSEISSTISFSTVEPQMLNRLPDRNAIVEVSNERILTSVETTDLQISDSSVENHTFSYESNEQSSIIPSSQIDENSVEQMFISHNSVDQPQSKRCCNTAFKTILSWIVFCVIVLIGCGIGFAVRLSAITVCNLNSSLKTLEHGKVTCTDGNDNSASSCSFSCDVTYLLKGNAESICLSNGNWSGIKPKCVKECSNPPDIDHATTTCDKSPSTENDTCSYSCKPGRTLSSTSIVQCMTDGTWTWTGGPTTCDCAGCRIGDDCELSNRFQDAIGNAGDSSFEEAYAGFSMKCTTDSFFQNVFELYYEGKCTDSVNNINSVCKETRTRTGAGENAVAQVIRIGLQRNIYPEVCDPAEFAKYISC